MYYIYEIYNKVSGRKYIGMTANHKKRFEQHMNHLRYGKHSSKLLQRDFVLYGKNSFDYRILETVENKTEAHQREKHYMILNKSYYEDFGYNGQDVMFNKYQSTNDSVNTQNFFYKKIKATGVSLNKVAEMVGLSRKSLIRGITHVSQMKADAFMKLVNFLSMDKEVVALYSGWITERRLSEHEFEICDMFSQLSEDKQELILQVAKGLAESNLNQKGENYG